MFTIIVRYGRGREEEVGESVRPEQQLGVKRKVFTSMRTMSYKRSVGAGAKQFQQELFVLSLPRSTTNNNLIADGRVVILPRSTVRPSRRVTNNNNHYAKVYAIDNRIIYGIISSTSKQKEVILLNWPRMSL